MTSQWFTLAEPNRYILVLNTFVTSFMDNHLVLVVIVSWLKGQGLHGGLPLHVGHHRPELPLLLKLCGSFSSSGVRFFGRIFRIIERIFDAQFFFDEPNWIDDFFLILDDDLVIDVFVVPIDFWWIVIVDDSLNFENEKYVLK